MTGWQEPWARVHCAATNTRKSCSKATPQGLSCDTTPVRQCPTYQFYLPRPEQRAKGLPITMYDCESSGRPSACWTWCRGAAIITIVAGTTTARGTHRCHKGGHAARPHAAGQARAGRRLGLLGVQGAPAKATQLRSSASMRPVCQDLWLGATPEAHCAARGCRARLRRPLANTGCPSDSQAGLAHGTAPTQLHCRPSVPCAHPPSCPPAAPDPVCFTPLYSTFLVAAGVYAYVTKHSLPSLGTLRPGMAGWTEGCPGEGGKATGSRCTFLRVPACLEGGLAQSLGAPGLLTFNRKC